MSIRTVHDVIFPEVVSFPLRQRLNLQGAFEDLTLPSPHFSDDTEQWSVVTDEVGSADVLEYDGLLQENAPRFERTRIVETMMAIEPDLEEQVDVDVDATPAFGDGSPSTDFAAIELNVAEAEEIGLQPTPAETREIVCDGRSPPVGWRRDDFGTEGVIRRSVWTPSWSTRPPSL